MKVIFWVYRKGKEDAVLGGLNIRSLRLGRKYVKTQIQSPRLPGKDHYPVVGPLDNFIPARNSSPSWSTITLLFLGGFMVRRLNWWLLAMLMLMLMLAACSPKFNWRDVHNAEAAYLVQLPDKPASLRRPVQLGSQTVIMQMTAAQVDGVRFAVGAAQLPTAEAAQANVTVMQGNLVRNMGGRLNSQHNSIANSGGKVSLIDEFEAGNASLTMQARLVAHGTWIYEVLVAGPRATWNQEAVDIFLASFQTL